MQNMVINSLCKFAGSAGMAVMFFFLSATPGQAVNQALLNAQEAGAALTRGNYDKAIELYNEALNIGGLPDVRRASVYNDQGVAFWRLKKLKEALSNFNKAISVYPEYAQAYNNRGNVLLEMKHPEEAIKDFDQSILLAPGFGAAYNNRANAYLQAGDMDQALKNFNKAIEFMPTNAVPFNGRGMVHKTLDRQYGSIRDLSRAVSLNREYIDAYLNRARAYLQVGEYIKALQDLSKAIAISPKDPELHFLNGMAQMGNKQYYRANKAFDKVLDLNEKHALALAERGRSKALRNKVSDALNDFTEAEKINPLLPEAFFYRVQAYLQAQDMDNALDFANKTVRQFPKNSISYRIRAEVHENMDLKDKAIEDLKKAVELNKQDIESWKYLSRLTGQSLFTDNREEEEKKQAEQEAEEQKDSKQRKRRRRNKPVDKFGGWSIRERVDGVHVFHNEKYPKIQARIEMYGEGEPKFLEYSKLSGVYSGLILLRYSAGKKENQESQYIAIIDTRKNSFPGIEPFLVRGKEAVWSWKDGTLTVTDAYGVVSEMALRRKPRPRSQSYERYSDSFWDDEGTFWASKPKKRRKTRRRKKKSFFESLFD